MSCYKTIYYFQTRICYRWMARFHIQRQLKYFITKFHKQHYRSNILQLKLTITNHERRPKYCLSHPLWDFNVVKVLRLMLVSDCVTRLDGSFACNKDISEHRRPPRDGLSIVLEIMHFFIILHHWRRDLTRFLLLEFFQSI